MVDRKLGRSVVVASVLFALHACGSEVPDRLVLRDGAGIDCRVQRYEGGTFLVEGEGAPASFQRVQVASVLFDVARGMPETNPPSTEAGDHIYLRSGKVVSSTLIAIDATSISTATGSFARDEVYRIDLAALSAPMVLPGLPGVEMCWTGWIDYKASGSWWIVTRNEDGTCYGKTSDPDVYLHPKLETHVEGVFVESINLSMNAPVPPPPFLDCTRGPCFLVPLDVRFEVAYEHDTRPTCTGQPYTPRWSFRRTGQLRDLLGLGVPEGAVGAGIGLTKQEDGGLASYFFGPMVYGPVLAHTLAFGWEQPHEGTPAIPFENANAHGQFEIGRPNGGDIAAPRRVEAGGQRIRGRFEWSQQLPAARRREQVVVDWDLRRGPCPEMSERRSPVTGP